MSRAIENGSLAFHEGTEQQLLQFVELNAPKNDLKGVIDSIDEFCWKHHWMMHIGNVKGKQFGDLLQKYKCKSFLELGTYCGYSALLALYRMGEGSTVITIDPNEQTNNIAKHIWEHAGVLDRVQSFTGTLEQFIDTNKESLPEVDCVFLDHIKVEYLADFLRIEKANILKVGGISIADNVVIFSINNYMDYVNSNPNYDEQQLYISMLEYTNDTDEDKKDGIHCALRIK